MDDTDATGGPSVIYLIKRLELAVRHRLDEALLGTGVTAVQYTLMSQLQTQPHMTGAELARRWHLTPQSISEILVGLETAGLVVRVPSPEHRRRLSLSLTPRGEELVRTIHHRVSLLDEVMLRDATPKDREVFKTRLRVARRSLDAGGPRP